MNRTLDTQRIVVRRIDIDDGGARNIVVSTNLCSVYWYCLRVSRASPRSRVYETSKERTRSLCSELCSIVFSFQGSSVPCHTSCPHLTSTTSGQVMAPFLVCGAYTPQSARFIPSSPRGLRVSSPAPGIDRTFPCTARSGTLPSKAPG